MTAEEHALQPGEYLATDLTQGGTRGEGYAREGLSREEIIVALTLLGGIPDPVSDYFLTPDEWSEARQSCVSKLRGWLASPAPGDAREGLSREDLPDPDKLDLLADWIDSKYPDDPNPDVQADLRRWAQSLRGWLASPAPEGNDR